MDLSRDRCYDIKGLAITLIMIHNFVNYLLGIECNEMVYSQKNTDIFLANIFSNNFIWYFFSYAGWIGVSLFFFLSGYGLTKKYREGFDTFNRWEFIKKHVFKLWKLLIPIFVIYIFFYCFVFDEAHNMKSVVAQITFTINLLSYGDNEYSITPGVYWFFGAILQFYILFLIVRKLNNKWLWVLCIMFLLINYYIIYFVNDDMMTWVRHNFIGWGVPFVLGMIAARTHLSVSNHVNCLVLLFSVILLWACLTIKVLSPLIESTTVIVFVSFTHMFSFRWTRFLGLLSPSIFAIHPLIRLLYYHKFTLTQYPFIMTVIYLIPVIVISFVHHYLMGKVEKSFCGKKG